METQKQFAIHYLEHCRVDTSMNESGKRSYRFEWSLIVPLSGQSDRTGFSSTAEKEFSSPSIPC